MSVFSQLAKGVRERGGLSGSLRALVNKLRRTGFSATLLQLARYLMLGNRGRYRKLFQGWFRLNGVDGPTDTAMFPCPAVLIVGSMDLPQCRKYRVYQKVELLEAAGVTADCVNWEDAPSVFDKLQIATDVIFYRLPWNELTEGYLAETRRLGLQASYDIDDPVFDREVYAANPNLDTLTAAERHGLVRASADYLEFMQRVDSVTVSTPGLAELARARLDCPVHVWPNLVDEETRSIVADLAAERDSRRHRCAIGYMSGSRAHDTDLESAVPALVRVLEANAEAELVLGGYYSIPRALLPFQERITALPYSGYAGYLRAMLQVDINIVPLVADGFNNCKSAIRYYEASTLGIPTVATAIGEFADVIENGVDGFLAVSADDWETALNTLVRDAERRNQVGLCASQRVLANRSTAAPPLDIAAIMGVESATDAGDGRRLLAVNVHFAPQSFGGATVVAEETCRRLALDLGWRVLVVTTHVDPLIPAYRLRRYRCDGFDVVSISLGDNLDDREKWLNPRMDVVLEELISRFRPSRVHCHALQSIGCGFFECLVEREIPFVVTVHDNWWLCERQFMIASDDRYCFQRIIDSERCRYCVERPRDLGARDEYLRHQLGRANLILAPSEYQREFYVANGFSADRCLVNGNGILPPRPTAARQLTGVLRFGFIGGPGAIKGADVINAAFASMPRRDYRLIVVDAAQNLGNSWQSTGDWDIPGELEIHAAYNRESIDEFFASIDVLLFPSQWRESFGLTVREALARDVWVIATGEGGVAEAIEDGVNGRLLPLSPDPRFLAMAITECLEAPGRFRSFINPLKDKIRYFDDQARELNDLLESASYS